MIAQRLTRDGEAAHVGPRVAVGNTEFEETRAAELRNEAPALSVQIIAVAAKMFGAPSIKPLGQIAVPPLEERPGKEASVDHRTCASIALEDRRLLVRERFIGALEVVGVHAMSLRPGFHLDRFLDRDVPLGVELPLGDCVRD